ncbi:hypothetical protein F4553_007780 [Allocatelliglobosispora scoriae]|uniref:DNA methylase adenine-specific domain-containing protein n=1 Tax=Allocatelliglobosispora scoriae TaxID=643052 RepID=A0A841C358_9ACTN|nr:N-6 DNA methylase [Allocatelliglobosispora scoriae]MBB5874346.1 hypothetical protein [Allocatelliglobosispora scoriae]
MDRDQADSSSRQATVTASGIAKMAAVGRAAVSNWRRRYADFPLPVGGTAASPVFDAAAIESWLTQQGKLRATSTGELVWRHIESLTQAAHMGDTLCLVGAYLLAQSGQPAPGPRARLLSPERLLARLRSRNAALADLVGEVAPAAWSPQLETILTAAVQLGQEQDPGAAFEYLHTQYVTSTRSLTGPDATPDDVAEIMVMLASSGPRIFDFSSGTGSVMRAAAERALHAGVGFQCFAQEIKRQHALTTLLRVWFVYEEAVRAGLPAEPPVVSVGDSLLADGFPELLADAVVANAPFGIHDWGHEKLAYDPRWTFGLPPRTEPELAWVQHALAHLLPGKRAVLLMPPAAAARPAGRRIRSELVRRGALQAVIALPAGLMPPAAIGLHLWVLVRPEPGSVPDPRLLFVDSAQSAPGKAPSRAENIAFVREVVERAWTAYGSGGPDHESGIYRIVPAVDVIDDEVDLTPRRYLPLASRPSLNAGDLRSQLKSFRDLLDEIRDGLPSARVTDAEPMADAPSADIADLVRSGSLSVHRAIVRTRDEQPENGPQVPAVTGPDVVAGGPPTGIASQGADQPGETRIRPDDVLIPVVARELVARVATPEQVGAELGPGVHAVRVDPDVLDPWFLAGVLSRTDNARLGGRVSTTAAGMLRIDVRRLAIPVLPIATQRTYGAAFRDLAAFQIALATAVRQGRDLTRDLTDGLAGGLISVEFGGEPG